MGNAELQRVIAALLQGGNANPLDHTHGFSTGVDPNNDQALFKAPPGFGTTLPKVVDPKMLVNPSQLPGDYSRLPYQGLMGFQGVPSWAFGSGLN